MIKTDLLIFLPSAHGGGAQRVMVEVAHHIKLTGKSVRVAVPNLEGAMGQLLTERLGQDSLINMNHKGVARSLPSLVRILKELQPSTFLTGLRHGNVAGVVASILSGFSGRLVLSEHNTLSRITSGKGSSIKEQLLHKLLPAAYKKADHIIAVSQGVKRDIIRLGIGHDKISVIYNPVVNPEMQALASDEQMLPPWMQSKAAPLIIGLGRLTEQKDFATLLEAFALVRRRQPCRLTILGEGPERRELVNLSVRLGVDSDFDLPGFVSNPYAYLAKADVMVLSSRWEGFGNVLVEALSFGVPVVATDCEHGPAEILDGGRYGRLIPIANAEALATAIGEAILVGNQGREERISRSKEFSAARIIPQYIEVLRI